MKLDKTVFALHKCIRERYLQYLEGFSLEQLAVIPEGFRNNLLWNISHAIVTQQLYCYYIPTQEEVDTLKELLISTQAQMEEDYQKGIFTTYTDYLTGLNYPLRCVEDAIYFNNTHEGMHLGLVIAIKYLI